MTEQKIITRNELAHLVFCNSDKIPDVINDNGIRKQWVGIGWFVEGPPLGDEVLVIDDMPQNKKRKRQKPNDTDKIR
ncbi:MAG: hypothetical protein NG747_00490 [Candidatus Brocadia sp.]|nr:hypothetical protein [Candidatus Brocadia sp.]